MLEVVRWVGGVVGVVIAAGTAASVFQILVVPRGRATRLANLVLRVVQGGFLLLARRARTYEAKDRLLSQAGPLTLLVLLLVWLLSFHLGYSLILWPLAGGTLWEAVRETGSSLFTLGFASRAQTGPTLLAFLAAMTGLLVVALQIAYLPVVYAAFSQREALVTTLQSRAGSPAWGPEILVRHHMVGIMDNLRHFYGEWEAWAAQVAESHANYPVLLYFRSPHALRSWIVGLVAVLDSAALYHAFYGDDAPSETRLCLRMGFTALRDIADVIGLEYDPDPDPDGPLALTYEEFEAGIRRMSGAGLPLPRTTDEAWAHFRGWRVNYESIAYGIAERVVAPPAPWSGPRSRLRGTVIEPYRPIDRRPGGEVRHIEVPNIPTD